MANNANKSKTYRIYLKSTKEWVDVPEDYLRAYMGHQSFSDTVYYIHLLPDRLMKSPGIDWEKIDRVGLEADLWLD